MKYNIIGDIHGRVNWRDLVLDDCVNVFVGDYFSPYHPCPFEEQARIFNEIIDLKKRRPETILLIGNHDEDHWHIKEEYSRFDYAHADDIQNMFESNKHLFQVAYSINNKILVTHAGVSILWYERYKNGTLLSEFTNLNKYSALSTIDDAYDGVYHGAHKPCDGDIALYDDEYYRYNLSKEMFEKVICDPDSVAAMVNDLWDRGSYGAFNFGNNGSSYDYYGDSATHGPLWIRPTTLEKYSVFSKDYWQVVGHTQVKSVFIHDDVRMVLVDVLGSVDESLIIDDDGFHVNKI